MQQGEIFVAFLDLMHVELQKPVSAVSMPKLESCFDTCLRSAAAPASAVADFTKELDMRFGTILPPPKTVRFIPFLLSFSFQSTFYCELLFLSLFSVRRFSARQLWKSVLTCDP